MNKERWNKLLEEMKADGLDGLVLVPGPNLYYMTGLRMGLSERPSLCAIEAFGAATFLMPGFEITKGENLAATLLDQGVEMEFRMESFSDEEGPGPAFARVFQGKGGTWGLEYTSARMLEYSLMKKAMGDFAFVDAGTIMKKLRMIKDQSEIRAMETACSLCDEGVDIARRRLLPGTRASDVVLEVERYLKERGAEAVHASFATGPDTAVPHAGTSKTPVSEGDIAWIDLCVSVGGYWGDITRTWAVGGRFSKELERVYRIVQEAQENARLNAKPGMSGAEIDALARDVIASYGYGDQFIHRTGHGLGLEVHEEPYIVSSNLVPLEAGMTFTIEPGIYLPGRGGVRIEDDVVLTADGARSLTNYPRNLADEDGKLVV